MPDTDIQAMAPLYQKAYDGDPVRALYGAKMGDVFRTHTVMENNGGGDGIKFEVVTPGSVVASMDYAIAGGAMAAFGFDVPLVNIHFRATVTRDAIDKAKMKGSKKLFEVTKMALDMGVFEALKKFDRHCAARRGEIGVIQAIVGSTLTLASPSRPTVADKSLTNRLKRQMRLVAGITPGAGVLKGADPGDVGTILSYVDATAVVTLTAAVPATWAVGDTLWQEGDAYFTQTLKGGRRTIAGALAWLDPTPAVNGELFYGLDRFDYAPDAEPLRFDCTDLPYRTALLRMASYGYSQDREFDLCLISSEQWPEIILEADAREIVTVTVTKDAAGGKKIVIGAQGIAFSNGAGGIMHALQWPRLESGIVIMGNSANAPFKIAYTDKNLIRLHTDGQDLVAAGRGWRHRLDHRRKGRGAASRGRSPGRPLQQVADRLDGRHQVHRPAPGVGQASLRTEPDPWSA